MLQHIYYYTFLLQKRPLNETVCISNLIIDFVEESDNAPWYMHTVWDGSISSIKNKNQMKIACWKLITDEWFETIV